MASHASSLFCAAPTLVRAASRPARPTAAPSCARAARSVASAPAPRTRPRSLRRVVVAAEPEGRPSSPPPPPAEAPETPGLKDGQSTAIITGLVSLILGVGYLGLAQVLGNRDMLPPPPEALGL